MIKPDRLRRIVRSVRSIYGDAYIDIAYHAKVHPSTVGAFVRGETRCPEWLTRWGFENYLRERIDSDPIPPTKAIPLNKKELQLHDQT